ncbi:Hypothetical protein SMAX5B_002080 [Scophthalmus maximus]|uniref:Uncharacterized protein n=1 Tax=Scophthalmus maximus TaxID=52904 RepID=A0A2U9CW67_SCOMX|nr:Hypothetical protein SMAX5B_002080 [Scophthalmus maximus]
MPNSHNPLVLLHHVASEVREQLCREVLMDCSPSRCLDASMQPGAKLTEL